MLKGVQGSQMTVPWQAFSLHGQVVLYGLLKTPLPMLRSADFPSRADDLP